MTDSTSVSADATSYCTMCDWRAGPGDPARGATVAEALRTAHAHVAETGHTACALTVTPGPDGLEEVNNVLVQPPGIRRYFHRTPAADAILAGGFRDATGSYLLEDMTLTGVFISDRPLDENEGAKGDHLLVVELPAGVDLDDYELVEDGKAYREWCVPAELLKAAGR